MPSNSVAGKPHVPQQVVVEEIEMSSGQPVDLSQRVVHPLRVERPAALEERVLVAEVAVLRTAARDDDRVGDEVVAPPDQVAADGRHAIERAARRRDVAARGTARAKVREETRKRLFTRAEEDRVGVRGGFLRQRRDVQAAEDDERSASPVVVRQPVRPAGIGDVDLDHDEIGPVVEAEGRHVLVFDHGFVVRRQVRRERREAEWREQRVLDGPPVGTRRLGEGGQDELDAQRPHGWARATGAGRSFNFVV